MSTRQELLLEFVATNGRVCPQPPAWNALWELLPARRRKGGGWEPAAPLILAAWWETTDAAKRDRLRDHIEWAAQHDVLDVVEAFLRRLPEEQWHHEFEA